MKIQTVKTLLGAVAIAGTLALTGQQAQAGTMHNGWNYSIDSFNDGTEGSKVGKDSKFEFYGMAFKQTADKVIFAFNSNLAETGYAYAHAAGGNIGYGDLMLDFTGKGNLTKANGGLQAVHFASNDMNREVGLYNGVTAKSVATANSGYYSTNYHTSIVNNVLKGKASYGDMASNTTYFNGNEAALNVIKTGTYKGGVTEISNFNTLGLDFGHFKATGTQTFGFSIDKSLLPKGNFVASLFAECGNDGMVLTGKVPEPSALVGLAAIGLMVGASQLRKRQSAAVSVEA
jgi:hypothetical protein